VLTIKETDEMKQKLKEGHRVSWFISAQLFMEIRDFFFILVINCWYGLYIIFFEL
jgi:hypothetical protein